MKHVNGAINIESTSDHKFWLEAKRRASISQSKWTTNMNKKLKDQNGKMEWLD
jgi:hypothetical protein